MAGVVAGGIVLLASVIAHGAWRERAGTTLLSGALCLAGLLSVTATLWTTAQTY